MTAKWWSDPVFFARWPLAGRERDESPRERCSIRSVIMTACASAKEAASVATRGRCCRAKDIHTEWYAGSDINKYTCAFSGCFGWRGDLDPIGPTEELTHFWRPWKSLREELAWPRTPLKKTLRSPRGATVIYKSVGRPHKQPQCHIIEMRVNFTSSVETA